MKRYELAKREGLNWQSILIADAESEIKEIIRDGVLARRTFPDINAKVVELINKTVEALESNTLKSYVKQSFPKFASKIYIQWVELAGTRDMGLLLLYSLRAAKKPIPPKMEEVLTALSPSGGYPDITYKFATANGKPQAEYEREVIKRIDEIANTHAEATENPHFTLRAEVERELRWEWHQEQIQTIKDSGALYVWIDTHANCSTRCQPWQGRLYSLNKTYGLKDGIEYQPLENATDIWEYTKSGKAWKNGCISGFSCRHNLIPYKNMNIPTEIPEKVIKHQREVEYRQRELERRVRFYEDRMQASPEGTPLYDRSKAFAKKWTAEYKKYSKANKVPYYPSRLDI